MARPIYWSPHGGITNDWPLERLLASVAGAGYAGIEAVATPSWMNWRDGGSVARLRATIERFGLTCPSVCWRGRAASTRRRCWEATACWSGHASPRG